MDSPNTANQPLILIAEDDPAAHLLLRRLLASSSYQTVAAEDGSQALEKCIALQPSLLLPDGMMPGLSGFQVCAHLKTLPNKRDIPVVMVTALDDQSSVLRTFEAGAADYVTSRKSNKH